MDMWHAYKPDTTLVTPRTFYKTNHVQSIIWPIFQFCAAIAIIQHSRQSQPKLSSRQAMNLQMPPAKSLIAKPLKEFIYSAAIQEAEYNCADPNRSSQLTTNRLPFS
jgi:hypothetical protein